MHASTSAGAALALNGSRYLPDFSRPALSVTQLIKGQPAYIVPQRVGWQEKAIACAIGCPLLAPEPDVAQVRTKPPPSTIEKADSRACLHDLAVFDALGGKARFCGGRRERASGGA